MTANDSPSPWGEGREGGRSLKLCERQLAETHLVWIINPMSAQEILLEEIKHQPEPVLREVLRYLKFLERQRAQETPMEGVVADTWEQLGPAPDMDYDKL
jgi:hypothetical protein